MDDSVSTYVLLAIVYLAIGIFVGGLGTTLYFASKFDTAVDKGFIVIGNTIYVVEPMKFLGDNVDGN